MAGEVTELSEDNFEREVTRATTPVLVDLWAAWCGPCRMVAPMIEELAKAYQDKVKFGKLNVDDHPQVASRFRVMNIPTLILFKHGQEVDRVIGVMPKEELARRVERLLA